jgi:hypothetical protein
MTTEVLVKVTHLQPDRQVVVTAHDWNYTDGEVKNTEVGRVQVAPAECKYMVWDTRYISVREEQYVSPQVKTRYENPDAE